MIAFFLVSKRQRQCCFKRSLLPYSSTAKAGSGLRSGLCFGDVLGPMLLCNGSYAVLESMDCPCFKLKLSLFIVHLRIPYVRAVSKVMPEANVFLEIGRKHWSLQVLQSCFPSLHMLGHLTYVYQAIGASSKGRPFQSQIPQ